MSRKQTQRALSENLELVSLKRLTLTTSQSLPKPGSHSLARTTTTVFSKSFEQVSCVTVANNRGGVSGTEANRFSACSLQEEKLIYGTERTDLPVLSKQPNQQRPPSISITLSTEPNPATAPLPNQLYASLAAAEEHICAPPNASSFRQRNCFSHNTATDTRGAP